MTALWLLLAALCVFVLGFLAGVTYTVLRLWEG